MIGVGDSLGQVTLCLYRILLVASPPKIPPPPPHIDCNGAIFAVLFVAGWGEGALNGLGFP